jgi:PadR family transcriptional regulator AphA
MVSRQSSATTAASSVRGRPARPLEGRSLSTSEYAILGLLSFGEKSGYELFRFAEQSVGFIWAPAKSQIYKVLPRLAAMGLVSTRVVEQTKRPDKQLYRLTGLGRRVLRQWLAGVEVDGDPDVYYRLKIFFGREAPTGVLATQVAAYRELTAKRLAQYEELDRRLPRNERNAYPLRLLALGLERARAAVAWADALLADLDD